MEIIKIGIQVGLLYGPFALGIYLALGVLSLPDLTLEGSFGIGGATTAIFLAHGENPALCLAAGIGAGAAAGLVTGILHVRMRMTVLLAGILMMSAAWSISIMIMGSGNVPLIDKRTVFTWVEETGFDNQTATILVGAGASSLAAAGLMWFLRTRYGLSLRASGMSIQTARGLGVRTESRQVIGVVIANGLAAASGGLVVQSQGFMDVSIQVGTIVSGLAALMIGLSLIRSPKVVPAVLGVLLGLIVYRVVVAWTLDLGMNPNYVRLATAGVVVLVIGLRVLGPGAALPGTAGASRQRRVRMQFYEDDRVFRLV
ncbi:MAG: putative tryptophan/tyrosine transport system permease protein [Microbacteriaceae bacterium]|nr:putative tryptophan/tyrosine transport system permease protein [Microbacteriaceae bacterium]